MEKEELVQEFASYWNIDKHDITDDLVLDSKNISDFGSIKFYRFLANLQKKFSIKIENVHTITTFADILTNVKE